ncbi:MAG: PGPGW domain-containing protein [Acidimicrobiales bacterium]
MSIDYSEIQPGIQPGEDVHGPQRILRIGLGVVLVIAGIAMLVLPGQGILTIILGLNLIKPDNAVVRWIRVRTPGIPVEGPVPTRAIVAGVAMFVAFGMVSLIWGQDIFNWSTAFVGL